MRATVLLFLWSITAVNGLRPTPRCFSRAPSNEIICRRNAVLRGFALAFLIPADEALAKKAPPEAFRFMADYDDQMHPLCKRHIEVREILSSDPKSNKANTNKRYVATLSGTDVGPVGIGQRVKIACDDVSIEKYSLRSWNIEGAISSDGQRIDAGDGIHEGTFNSVAQGATFDGIRWKDGNRWIINNTAKTPHGAD
mmetsp:Transcript_25120/g.36912  ORF Transcript_25120/g.36912 Transcript_25120/m.36912 type:complete len:197 (+) Transcript_25120:95-685(+)